MYKIKRHKILNLYYIHDQYSGPITSEYEIIEEDAGDYNEAYSKLEEYQDTSTPNVGGLFEDYYKYEHMKGLWGDPLKVQPTIGQLFYTCRKETFNSKRTIFELHEVKAIEEPYVKVINRSADKSEQMTIGQFQGLALIPEREENFILDWETRTGIKYPRYLISKLSRCRYYYNVLNRTVYLAQHITDWDLPILEINKPAV